MISNPAAVPTPIVPVPATALNTAGSVFCVDRTLTLPLLIRRLPVSMVTAPSTSMRPDTTSVSSLLTCR